MRPRKTANKSNPHHRTNVAIFKMASSDEENEDTVSRSSTNSGNLKFSEEAVSILEQLYSSGMNGWGADHSQVIGVAVNSTGLTLSQVKVCVIYFSI